MIRVRAAFKRWMWPMTLPVAAALWLAEPFLKLRFGRMCAERIGHLAANTEVVLRQRRLGQRTADETLVFFASGPIANVPLLTLYRRLTPVFVNNAASSLFSLCEPWLKHTRFFFDPPFQSNEYDLWNDVPPIVAFTPEEEERGRAGLRRMGIGPHAWFVTFFTRDPAYLQKRFPSNDYAYHDFRNTSIQHFEAAAKFVVAQGGFAVRMGAAFSTPLPPEMEQPGIIDYARLHRDDFMDVFLMAKSRFVITSDTGLGHLAVVFGVPAVNTNAICLDWAGFLEKDIFIPKRYFDTTAGRVLDFREVLDRGLGRLLNGHELGRRGIRMQENSPEEILEAVKEMVARLEGSWHPAPEDEKLQNDYRSLFGPGHTCFGFRSRIGANFIRRNRTALLPETQAR